MNSKLKALYYPNVPFDTLFIPYIYKEIYLDGIYVDIFNEKKDMTVIDVGANIGIVTQYMRDFSKKVYAIEPSPEHFEALKANKEHNDWDNVEVFNLALADRDGEMGFSINEGNRTMNSLMVGDKQEDGSFQFADNYRITSKVPYNEEKLMVKTLRFDTFMRENGIEEVDFVKFDVEGAEDMILRSEGFINVASKIKAIEVEFHFPSWPQLVEHMAKLGFTARRYPCSAVVVLFTR